MSGLLTETFLAALLSGAVVAAVPLILAGLGEQMSERAGVLNIGLEGMILGGAYAGFAAAVGGWGIWGGFAAGILAGMALAMIMVVFCVRLGINQIIVGIAITLGVTGVTALLHNVYFARTYPRLPAPEKWAIPGLSQIPLIGPGLFDHHLMTYAALLAPFVLMWLYKGSFLGLNLSAAGEKPEALDAAGIDVTRTRTTGALFAGAMAGLGGAYLSEIGSGIFVPAMSHGSGFIAIVLAMLARHRPVWVMGGALLFGLCLSAATALQVGGVEIPTDFIQMLPFAMVMAVLIAFGRKARLPAALGTPYRRGQR
ncbi:ABC transporter permease [Pseudooceanicola nanhaiensis]|uniref:ABC transporter permease n=1 Tax=Pseudooceanicola nanhaiensis TaxID=375761 RepID=UPI001CD418BE|nr:ABC transporter permease [Pseudooceanicola nanhaiensis]MCA0921281.1 ABC transporter permease [Pseudooceanicola nanhaiensis]